jgi:AraC-like DNA-binding protein
MTVEGESLTPEGNLMQADQMGGRELFFRYPDFIKADREYVKETRQEIKPEHQKSFKGDYYELYFKDVHFWHGKLKLSSTEKVELDTQSVIVKLIFSPRCRCSYSTDNPEKPFASFDFLQHNMIILPRQKTVVELSPDEDFELISISLSPDFLFRYLPDGHDFREIFDGVMETNIPAKVSGSNFPLTPKLMMALKEILHCTRKGCFKRLYTESKIIEILTILLEQYDASKQDSFKYDALKSIDVEKMHQVRTLLTRNMEIDLSLKDLAKMVGTNEYYLKRNFKAVFGESVFRYLHQMKMEKAIEMIKQHNKKVAEIASILGYKHPTHFTAAFKKYFGFLPNQVT